MAKSTVDRDEVARFSALAEEWWNAKGPLAPLHRLNPIRLAWIKEQVSATFDRDPKDPNAYRGLRFLDVGCGGGLVAEPLCRLGAEVVAIDPSKTNIEVARRHAAEGKLAIDYRATTAEALAGSGETFDVVTMLEVVEHVTDVPGFVGACCGHGETRRPDCRRDDQPNPQGIRARHCRGRICAALAATRHPQL